MTQYSDIPCVEVKPQSIIEHVLNEDKMDDALLNRLVLDLIKQHGFTDHESPCLALLQTCLVDICKDLSIRFKDYIESVGTSLTTQDALERTLKDVMAINLHELHRFMKKSR